MKRDFCKKNYIYIIKRIRPKFNSKNQTHIGTIGVHLFNTLSFRK